MKETNFNNAGRFFPHDVDWITSSKLTTMVTFIFLSLVETQLHFARALKQV